MTSARRTDPALLDEVSLLNTLRPATAYSPNLPTTTVHFGHSMQPGPATSNGFECGLKRTACQHPRRGRRFRDLSSRAAEEGENADTSVWPTTRPKRACGDVIRQPYYGLSTNSMSSATREDFPSAPKLK